MTKEFDNMLSFDPLAGAEAMTGKSYKDDHETLMIGIDMLLTAHENRRIELAFRGDTYDGIPLVHALDVFEREGFQIVGRWFADSPDSIDGSVLLWKDGVLLVCQSHGMNISKSNIYYNWSPNDVQNPFTHTETGRFYPRSDGREAFAGSHDVRRGFLHILRTLMEHGTFEKTWEAVPRIHVVPSNLNLARDFEERGELRAKNAEVNRQVLAGLPENIKKAMGI